MKKFISLLLALLLMVSLIPSAAAAPDEATEAAQTLYELGLFRGTGTNPDGTPIFDLAKTPTRNQAVIMLVRLLGKEAEALAGDWDLPFTDVPKGSTAYPYIGYAYANGLTNGTSATTYSGGNPMKANQYITFVLRALGYTSGEDFKVSTAWEFSDQIGLTDGEYSATTKTFTRGDVASISCAALAVDTKGTGATLGQGLEARGVIDGEVAVARGVDLYGLTNDVHLLYDIRTFTLFAFMNYTGYDDNNGRPIVNTRWSLRNDLAQMNLQISSPNYFTEKANAKDYHYVNALAQMGPAPEFRYLSTQDTATRVLSDLPQKLSEFYYAANIPALYEKYRADHEEILNQYDAALPDVATMVYYFDAQNIVESEFGLEVVLLDAWNRGSGLGNVEPYYGYGVIRTGPAAGVNGLNVLHEYAHGFVDRAVDANQAQASALSRYYKSGTNATKQGYDSWIEIAHESFVRAISLYFDSTLSASEKQQILNKEMNDGFVMTKYVYQRIPEFETFNGDFQTFIRMLLVEYPQYA